MQLKGTSPSPVTARRAVAASKLYLSDHSHSPLRSGTRASTRISGQGKKRKREGRTNVDGGHPTFQSRLGSRRAMKLSRPAPTIPPMLLSRRGVPGCLATKLPDKTVAQTWMRIHRPKPYTAQRRPARSLCSWTYAESCPQKPPSPAFDYQVVLYLSQGLHCFGGHNHGAHGLGLIQAPLPP